MKVVLLAGGFGTRILEESRTIPKPLVEIGGRPIIWHIMKIFAHHGLTDFIVCCGYRGEALKRYFQDLTMTHGDVVCDLGGRRVDVLPRDHDAWTVTLVDTGEGTMTGGRLRRVGHLIDGPFCMTYGDGVGDIDIAALVAGHARAGLHATLTAVRPPAQFGALSMDGERVCGFREKHPADGSLINGGFFVLEPEVLDLIDGDTCVWERGPLERLAAEGQLRAHRHDGFWQPMDTLRDKTVLEELWNGGRAPWKVWAATPQPVPGPRLVKLAPQRPRAKAMPPQSA